MRRASDLLIHYIISYMRNVYHVSCTEADWEGQGLYGLMTLLIFHDPLIYYDITYKWRCAVELWFNVYPILDFTTAALDYYLL